MIKAHALVKRFGDFVALDHLETQIPHGSIYGVVGPNGSGKSTLLRLIAGVYYPDDGAILMDDEIIYENVCAKQDIFFLSDDLYFLPKFTLDEMAYFYKSTYHAFSMEKYRHLLTMFPLNPRQKVSEFSKGMRRQGAILLALSANTSYLLLDEAFDGLDPVIRLMVKRIIADEIAERNMTVIVTSHNLRELEDFCDQVGLLHKGRLLFEKDLDQLKLGFCKVQAVFQEPVALEHLELSLLKSQQQGSVWNLVVRGSEQEATQALQKFSPIFMETLPLTLEEVFIGEMEAVGYDYSNLLF